MLLEELDVLRLVPGVRLQAAAGLGFLKLIAPGLILAEFLEVAPVEAELHQDDGHGDAVADAIEDLRLEEDGHGIVSGGFLGLGHG